MRTSFLSAALFLTALSTGLAASPICKDDFESQSAGQKLSDLTGWKFYEGWIKPEDGKIVVEKGNKFLRMKGDIFLPDQCNLADKLTFRFDIRSPGTNEEVGGFFIRSGDDTTRYDILCAYQAKAISVIANMNGQTETVGQAEPMKADVFQNVVVEVERVADGVKFTVSVDGTKVIERVHTKPLPMMSENFTVGFFTYNDKLIDLDNVDFTRGN